MKETHSSRDLFHTTAEVQSRRAKLVALLCALVVAVSLFWGYRHLHTRQLQRARAIQVAAQLATTPPPVEAQIFEDEAKLRGAEALIGGTVSNISGASLEDLSLELELKKRAGQSTELRQVSIAPNNLRPGESGHYNLTLPSNIWSGARVIRLASSKRNEPISFKSAPGERRPPERLPNTPKVVVVPPRPKSSGEEFINTPDNPTRIP